MALLVTEAIVLHSFDYLESSRIVQLVTRDAGVRSAIARGARRSSRRFGTSLDVYAEGTVELHVKRGRDLDTLGAFDVRRARPQLAADLRRFTGAGAIAELTIRFGGGAADAGLFAVVAGALDDIGGSVTGRADDRTLAAAWRLLAQLGVAPVVDRCADCHRPIADDTKALFSHPAGGLLCAGCARTDARGGRPIPGSARRVLSTWLAGGAASLADDAEVRAHQRLLREFLREHLSDGAPLRAFDAWEHGGWSGRRSADEARA